MADSSPDTWEDVADDIRRGRASAIEQAEARVAELETEVKALADDRGALMQAVMRETARALSLRASCEAALAMLREDRPQAALALLEETIGA